MTKDEALKLALEALERCVATCFDPYAHEQAMSWSEHVVNQTITAIKEALAQPEQEPVAFVQGCNRGQWEIFPAKAYQIFENEQPLYTTPPQRTWVGLTLDERIDLAKDVDWPVGAYCEYAEKIENKLKEKNT